MAISISDACKAVGVATSFVAAFSKPLPIGLDISPDLEQWRWVAVIASLVSLVLTFAYTKRYQTKNSNDNPCIKLSAIYGVAAFLTALGYWWFVKSIGVASVLLDIVQVIVWTSMFVFTTICMVLAVEAIAKSWPVSPPE